MLSCFKNASPLIFQAESCCGYGADGAKSTGVFDCLQIPGIQKVDGAAIKAFRQCGGKKGLATASDGASATVCSKYISEYTFLKIYSIERLRGSICLKESNPFFDTWISWRNEIFSGLS